MVGCVLKGKKGNFLENDINYRDLSGISHIFVTLMDLSIESTTVLKIHIKDKRQKVGP